MAEISSLIPKKTLGGGASFASSVGVGVFFRISFILFLASAMLSGGLYLAENYIVTNLAKEKSLLKKIAIEFEPTLISELERVAKSIRAAQSILKTHTRTSKIFDLLEAHTLTEVAFRSFDFSIDKKTATISGEAPNYTTIAAQASIFGSLPEAASVTYSNMALNKTGTVAFSMTINLK